MEDKLARQKELTGRLREAARAYYQEGREIMPNIDYDRYYDELLELEKSLLYFTTSLRSNEVVLEKLMRNQGIVLTRDQLLAEIWGYDFDGETRTVDVHIRTLRQKLGEKGEIIQTVRGVGYRVGGDA